MNSLIVQSLGKHTWFLSNEMLATIAPTIDELKKHLCGNTLIQPSEISIISSGKKLSNLMQTSSLLGKIFILLTTVSARTITFAVQDTSGKVISLDLPLNMRVGELKQLLYKQHVTPITVGEQRLVCFGRVLKDAYYVGDYVLVNQSTSRYLIQQPTIYVSKTVNLRQDIVVKMTFCNTYTHINGLTFTLEIGDTLCYIWEILSNQHRLQVHEDVPHARLFLSDGRPLSDEKSLYDYGINSSDGSVDIILTSAPFGLPTMLIPRKKCSADKKRRRRNEKEMFKGMKKGFLG